jgi:hypothetical protein
MKRSITLAVLILLVATAPAWSADATAALDINSAYVWRGITFNDGLVAQPSMDVTAGNFGFNVWGNMDLADYNDTLDANNFSEIDLTLSYGITVWKIDLGVGLIEYLFPAGGLGTREIYLSASMPIIAGLSAGVDLYYDVDEFHGLYAIANLGYALDITEKFSVEAGASAAYATEEVSAGGKSGMDDYCLSLSASYALTDAFSVGAGVNYVGSLDDEVLPDGKYGTGLDTQFYGGVNVSYSF